MPNTVLIVSRDAELTRRIATGLPGIAEYALAVDLHSAKGKIAQESDLACCILDTRNEVEDNVQSFADLLGGKIRLIILVSSIAEKYRLQNLADYVLIKPVSISDVMALAQLTEI